MFVIIGLGNPGKKYHNNRHNVGHKLVDYLKSKNIKMKLLKTDCFMNVSGSFVKKIISRFKIKTEELIIAHDDLDIPLGSFKIQKAEGPKLHRGLVSIEKALKTKNFWRIRIGIDNRSPQNRCEGETYVLQDFLPQELEILENQVFPKIPERLKTVLGKTNNSQND